MLKNKLLILLFLIIISCSTNNSLQKKNNISYISEIKNALANNEYSKVENLLSDFKRSSQFRQKTYSDLLKKYLIKKRNYYKKQKNYKSYCLIYKKIVDISNDKILLTKFINESFQIILELQKKGEYSSALKVLDLIENYIKVNPQLLTLKIKLLYNLNKNYEVSLLLQKYDEMFDLNTNKTLNDIKLKINVATYFHTYRDGNFIINYNSNIAYDTVLLVSKYLNQAMNKVNSLFSWLPEVKINVLLYSSNQYYKELNYESWSSGFFDGKIRLFVIDNYKIFKATIFHEYTHAVMYQKAGYDMISYWFSEGLAKYVESTVIPYKRIGLLYYILPSEIDKNFKKQTNLNAAYYESYLIIKYIIDNYSSSAISSIVKYYKDFFSINLSLKKEIFVDEKELFNKTNFYIQENLWR